jgi:hypothetical protein
MKHMSRLARIERLLILLTVAVLVVGVIAVIDLWDAARLHSDLRQMVQDESSHGTRLHALLLPRPLSKTRPYMLGRPPQPGAQPSTHQIQPGASDSL